MKKQLLLSAFILLGLASCSNEQTALNTMENMKTSEMEAFDKAFIRLGEPQNQPTQEERRNNSVELSDRRKEILIPASKALIISTGVSKTEINKKTGGDKAKIIAWALDINFKKKDEIYRKMKSDH